ncbi:hypothetical protein KKA33_01630 [Patescibacteria group bacterium]|nr:hypothetical protein [Patescibacteria group bacterium]
MKKPKDAECPENPTPLLRIGVRTVEVADGRIRIENDQPCDPAKVRRLIKGVRVGTKKVAAPKAEETENKCADPELDEILESLEAEKAEKAKKAEKAEKIEKIAGPEPKFSIKLRLGKKDGQPCDQPCDPAKVRLQIKGEKIKNPETGQGEKPAESESGDPELDAMLKEFIKNMP